MKYALVEPDQLLPHEHVVKDRLEKLVEYMYTLKPYAILPAILVCSKTNVIIDGHHRYYALQNINIKEIPVVYINYDSDLIVPVLDNSITKKEIIETAIHRKLLKPKSSFHHILDIFGKPHPLILISPLSDFKLTKSAS